MQKKLDIIYIVMIVFPILISVISLFYIEDMIPAHYGVGNEVTRWGNKLEILITPIITVIFGVSMRLVSNTMLHSKSSSNSVLGNLMVSIGSVLIFDVLSVYFVYCAVNSITNLGDVSVIVYVVLVIAYVLCIYLALLVLKHELRKV